MIIKLAGLITASLFLMSNDANAQTISGAGATFPAPLYSKWSESYNKETGKQLNYQAIGSGGGIKQIDAKTVDFGASDDPVKVDDLKAKGQYQFPTAIGGVVPVVNLTGIEAGQVTLDGPTLAGIFSGKITSWKDPAIKKLNPKVSFPDMQISVVVRADSSGTTAVFTDYLSQVSEDFKKSVGAGKTVTWNKISTGGGKGNAGVSAMVQQIQGSIGYVEYSFAKQGKLKYTSMLDKKGRVVQPDDETFAEAAHSANWNIPGMAVNLNNQNGWPITAATFIIVYETATPASKEAIKFFDWAFTKGDKEASALDYVPLPEKVKNAIRSDWKRLGFL
jgi:phosphate transport system substrate-binding protein